MTFNGQCTAMLRVFTAAVILLFAQVETFIIQTNLDLEHHNFAFLTSFCGKPTGAVLKYHIDFPSENCCPSLLSYFESQWWEIWPDPHKNCTEKQSVLRTEWSQIQPMRLGDHLAGCRHYTFNTTNSTDTHISCEGERIYEVDSYDPSKPKCWFIAASNCQSRGLKMSYTFNITGADYNGVGCYRPTWMNVLVFMFVTVLNYLVL